MNKSAGAIVESEWKKILKNHPTFARVLLAQQAVLIEASQKGNKQIDFNMWQIIGSKLPVIFGNYWADRGQQDFGNMQISPQLSCILEAEDGNPAACFRLNPDDSWLDIPPDWEKKITRPYFPPEPPELKAKKAPAAKKSVRKTAVKAATARSVKTVKTVKTAKKSK